MLTDWEVDQWTRVYCKMNNRNATLLYTFSKKDAKENVYPEKFTNIAKTLLKVPEKVPKRSISPRGRQVSREPALERSSSQHFEFNLKPVHAEPESFYHLKIVLETGKEIGMRSTRLEPLKNLAE